ncbi:PaaI family thioesterase [Sorangium sp. So ce887]|uniref:PaaI family thioesterase n=1 Tax=Sorangium sp. So ce887 TaxID=3133324 RepID=UPI003F60663A
METAEPNAVAAAPAPAATCSRTVRWRAPEEALARTAGLTGLEMLQQIQRGELPAAPMAATFEMRPADLGPGHAAFEATPGEWAYNPLGTVHGGYAATLLDTALGCAVHTALPAGKGYTTLELKVNYVRAMTAATGPVRAEAHVIHVGSRVATAEGRLVGKDDGKLYAHATTTCLVLDGK